MPSQDQYSGMPLYLRQRAQQNLRAVDRSVYNFNSNVQGTRTPAPIGNPAPTSASPTPTIVPAPTSFALGAPIDTALGQPVQPVTTAAARISPTPFEQTAKLPPQIGLLNGAYKTNPAAYGQTSSSSNNGTSHPDAYKTSPQAYDQTGSTVPRRPSVSDEIRKGFGWDLAHQ